MIKYFYKNKEFIISYSILLFFSFISIYLNNGHLNNDAILYLRQANEFVYNFEEALNIYQWSFYSFLISVIHKITNLTIYNSALLINFLMIQFLFIFYLLVTFHISKNKKIFFLSTLILLSSCSIFNVYLPMIIRDHGMWLFFILSLLVMNFWLHTQKPILIFLTLIFILIGFMFRPEIIIYLISFPIFLLMFYQSKLKIFFKQIIPFLILLFLFFYLFLFINNFSFSSLGFEHLENLISRFFSLYKILLLMPLPIFSDNYFFNQMLISENIFLKFILLLGIFSKKVILGIGGIFLILIICIINSDKKRFYKDFFSKNISYYFLLFTIFVNLIIAFINFGSTYVLSTRYLIPGYLCLYILSSIFIFNIYEKHRNVLNLHFLGLSINRLIFLSFFIIFISIFLNFGMFKIKNSYEKTAATWIQDNIRKDNIIFFNDRKLYFYTYNKFLKDKMFSLDKVKNYDYLIFKNDHRTKPILDIPNFEIIKFFPNKEKQKIVIFKRNNLKR